MAHGSSKGFRRYVNKVFGLRAQLGKLSDTRREPTVPQAPVLGTGFWGLARRLPSTQQVGDLLKDKRWRKHVGLGRDDGGSPDTAARVLDQLLVDEVNELALAEFFTARRAGVLKDDGPYGLKCAIVDMNELFASEKVHCSECQQRRKMVGEGVNKHEVIEYYHQAVALVWASTEMPWPIAWEVLRKDEGELTAALRLLARVLPRLSKSLDMVLGDGLYCCRPFFKLVHEQGVDALAVSSYQTEMDEEIEYFKSHEKPELGANKVSRWELESQAWERNVGCKLRVLDYENGTARKSYRHERKHLRVVTTAKVEVLPSSQGWQVARCRWVVENGAFNILTRDYALEHNYHHNTNAILMLLVLRSLAHCLTLAYRRFATARAKDAPVDAFRWWKLVLEEDWVRDLDAALAEPTPATG